MIQQRNKPRVYTNEMNHFTVRLSEADGTEFTGYVGDISEEGLCAILPGEAGREFAAEVVLKGEIGGSYLPENMSFSARLVWQAAGEERGETVRLLGLQFQDKVDLPDQVIAALMVSDE